MKSLRSHINRSRLRLLVTGLVALVLMDRGLGGPTLAQGPNPISIENQATGDTDWDISGAGDPTIQGFATDISVNTGATVSFKIKTNANAYKIDIYRLGYYSGAGARKVATVMPSATLPQSQPSCITDAATGNTDCGNWAESASWVSTGAVSGIYVAKLTRTDTGGASHVVFVVRDDARQAQLLVQTSDTTWQAYNRYGTGSLYCGGPISNAGSAYINSCATRSAKVSYNRPFDTRAHDPQSWLFNAEYPMVRWLEANGYDVKYWAGVDTDRRGADLTTLARKPRAFLSVGHDEYWSGNQRTQIEAARNAGVNLAFFSGNEMFWKTRWEPSLQQTQAVSTLTAVSTLVTATTADPHGYVSGQQVRIAGASPSTYNGTYTITVTGPNTFTYVFGGDLSAPSGTITATTGDVVANRTLVAYKETLAGAKIDPTSAWTGTWRDPRFSPPADGGRPENAVTGNLWTVNSGDAALRVPAAMANLRLWQNTRVPALGGAVMTPETVGYEWDEDVDNGSRPAGLIHLSSTTVVGVERLIDYGGTVQQNATATHTLTMYRHNSGALVFGAGTVQWSWGLDGEHDRGGTAAHVPDQAMQQATVTLLADMGAQPATLQIGADPNRPLATPAASGDIFAPTSVITSPSSGTVDNGTRVTINGTALDNGGGVVASVEVSVDGGTTWHVASGTSTWSFDWSPNVLGAATIRSRAVDDSGNLESAGAGVSVNVVVGTCPCTSLWRPAAAPTVPSAADSSAVELGVKFKSDIDGFITGIRFYKGQANSGTHVGNLWSINGTRLASAVFASETTSGWQQVSFGTPVAITANTTYVASYHTNVGGYSADGAYFANAAVDSPPLHAPPTGLTGGNGVYQYGSTSFPTNSFNATNYWVDVVFAPSLTDSTAPTISSIKATTIDSSRVTITWSTDEEASSRIEYGTNPSILTDANPPAGTVTVTNASFSTQHTAALTGLQSNTTYYYRLTAADRSGNTSRVAAPSFTLPGPTLRDTTATDFEAGTNTGTYVSQTADGEAILAPVTGSEFSGPSLPRGWIEVPWGSEGYSVIVNGVLLVDGARVATCVTDVNGICIPGEDTVSTPSAIYTAPHSLEFSANFSGDQFQHAGFAVTFGSASEPWAIFSTLNGGLLFARTNTGNGSIDTGLGTGLLGAFHRYRVDWKAASVDYYVDGALVVTHALTVAGPMRPVAASDYNPFGGTVFVDWMRMTSYASAGSFDSRVFDANSRVDWRAIQWSAKVPSGTGVAIKVRTGNTPTPDGSWSDFVPVQPGALALNSQFIQYRAEMTSSDPNQTPALEDIIISTDSAPVAVADSATVPENGSHTFPASGPGSLTANDSDADAADTLRVVSATFPGHGTAVVNADGSVIYTPASNYNGPDSFIYTVSDGLLTASAPVTLDVRFGNIAPVSNNDFYSVNEDTTLSVSAAAGLLANDTDVEHDPLTAILVSLPAHGLLTLSANGAFSYAPNPNYAGPDTFTYKANDYTDDGNIATVTINVIQVNDPPITEADAFTAVLNQPLDVPAPGVLRNDHDVEVEDTVPLHAQLVNTTTHGQLTFRADGSFSYVPDADYLGVDTFRYSAVDHFDAVGNANTVTLTVAIKAVSAVVAGGATVATGGDVSTADPLQSAVTSPTSATVAISQGVIAASQAPSGYTFLNQQVNITITDATGAEVTASAANPIRLVFTIDRSLIPPGQTELTFEMFRNGVRIPNCLGAATIPAANLDPCITARESGAALNNNVRLTVITSHASHWNMGLSTDALGTDPVAQDDGSGYQVDFQAPLLVPAPGVLGNDYGSHSLTAVLFGTPNGGTVDLAPSGAFTFTPDTGRCGPASFTYKAHDGTMESNVGTVSLNIDCTPHAGDDAVTVLEDSGASTITVMSNDNDPDPGQTLKVIAVGAASHGAAAIVGNGMAVSYAPQGDFFGSDSFTYTVSDGHNGSATATVTITVTPVNDAPSFTRGADQTVPEDAGPQSIANWATNRSAGPANESGQGLSFLVSNNNNALFAVQPVVASEGSLTFTSAPDANGPAIVTVRIQDDGGTSDGGVDTSAPQTFVINVTAVNDAPVAVADAVTTAEDTPLTLTQAALKANDTDVDNTNAELSVTAVSNPINGSVVLNGNGTVTFTPAADFDGIAGFDYTVSDGALSSSAHVTVTVTAVNDAPVAVADAATVAEDTLLTLSQAALKSNDTDVDNTNAELSVIAVSNASNGSVVLNGDGTITFTPAANFNGTAGFDYTVSDGALTSSAHVTVTVTAVNDAPTISDIANQTISEDGTTGPLTFTIGDVETATSGLTVLASSSNPTLVPNANIVLGGSNGSRTIAVTPAANQYGNATITVTVTDADGGTASDTFVLTVTSVNDVPTISDIANQTINEDGTTGPLTFTIGDVETAASSLTVSASSSNPTLVPNANIVFAGSNGSRTVAVTPAANQHGSATITVTVTDADGGTASDTFVLTVTSVNDAPTFVRGPDVTVFGNPAQQRFLPWATAMSAGPSDEAGQALNFIVTNDNNAMFTTQPSIDTGGNLTFRGNNNVKGTVTVTVQLHDNGGGTTDTSAPQFFTITFVKAGTSTTSASSPSVSSLNGQAVTFTATVAPAQSDAGTPTGQVLFMDGGTQVGSGILVNGQATFTTSSLGVGTHSIVGIYQESADFLGSISTTTSQTVNPSATLKVNFTTHAVQDGTQKPKVTDMPIPNAEVRVYVKKDQCPNGFIVTGQPKIWGKVFDGLDGPGGTDPGCSYIASGVTNASGNVDIIVPPTSTDPNSDYIVIGRSMGGQGNLEAIYSEKTLPTVRAGDQKKTLLHEIRTFSGKRVPGKDLEEYGTYLGIVEPEYIDWTNDQELYPFILVAEGDWSVTTDITPPEGFVAEQAVLSTSVADATGAIQFTITDVGSVWSETVTKHTILHKGETRIRNSGVRMFNHKPTKAKPDAKTVVRGPNENASPVAIAVLSNDDVAEGKTITVSGIGPALGGTVSVNGDGSLSYVPRPDFSGVDTFTYTIVDNEGVSSTATVTTVVAIMPQVGIGDVSLTEGNSGTKPATFLVTLSAPTLVPVSVGYGTVNGTAVAGTDYVPASGTLVFAPGEVSKTIVVSIVGDSLYEPNRSFIVRLGSIISAIVSKGDGIGTIVDDDPAPWTISSLADLVAGTVGAGSYISETGDGELILSPTVGAEFSGTALPTGWTGTGTVANGVVTIDGGSILAPGTYGSGRSLEFVATFSGQPNQNAGFGLTTALLPPFAMFGTNASGVFSVRSVAPGTALETPIPGSWVGAPHRFRIDWNSTSVVYSIDGNPVATHSIQFKGATASMRPAATDLTVGGGALVVDWMRMTPYASSGLYTSKVFDAGATVAWLTASWTATIPAGTAAVISYRLGNTPTPDGTWTAYQTVATSGAAISGSSRYIQFKVQESTTVPAQTPVVKDLTFLHSR